MRSFIALALAALITACAGPGGRVESSTSAIFAKDVGVVRAAAVSSLMRTGLMVEREDGAGDRQHLVARGEDAALRVAFEQLTPRSTRMSVSVLAEPESDALERFVRALEAVLGPRKPSRAAADASARCGGA